MTSRMRGGVGSQQVSIDCDFSCIDLSRVRRFLTRSDIWRQRCHWPPPLPTLPTAGVSVSARWSWSSALPNSRCMLSCQQITNCFRRTNHHTDIDPTLEFRHIATSLFIALTLFSRSRRIQCQIVLHSLT